MSISYRDIFNKGFDEYRQFVNPLIAERATLANEPVDLRETKDGRLVNSEGQEFENFHGTQFFGHRKKEIDDAIRSYLDSNHPEWFPSRVSPFAGRLAKQLCQRTGYSQVYFGLSGSDGVEAALKLARAISPKAGILSLEGAYHGCNWGSTALMSKGPFRDPFEPHLPGVSSLPFNDVVALQNALATKQYACIVVEAIQGEGGVRALSTEYIEVLCRETESNDCLLIVDEIQTGLGRSGSFLLSSHWPRQPDAVIIAKQLGGGLAPISALLSKMELFQQAYGQQFESAESHNMTFSYNSIGMVAGLATLELLSDEVVATVAEKGVWFKKLLEDSLTGSPLYGEVRGEGLMLGVKLKDLSHPWMSFEHFGFPGLGGRSIVSPMLARRLYQHGYFCFTCGHDWSVFRLQPRFDISQDKLQHFARVLRQELDYLNDLN